MEMEKWAEKQHSEITVQLLMYNQCNLLLANYIWAWLYLVYNNLNVQESH